MKKGFRILKFKKDKPIFEVKDVSKSFDGRPILKKISMEMYPGEIVGLLGPNGSGKSTLYSTVIGEQPADSGKILVKGNDISEKPIHERAKAGIGYLSQHRSVFGISVRDNLLGVAQISIKGSENQVALVEKWALPINEVTDPRAPPRVEVKLDKIGPIVLLILPIISPSNAPINCSAAHKGALISLPIKDLRLFSIC